MHEWIIQNCFVKWIKWFFAKNLSQNSFTSQDIACPSNLGNFCLFKKLESFASHLLYCILQNLSPCVPQKKKSLFFLLKKIFLRKNIFYFWVTVSLRWIRITCTPWSLTSKLLMKFLRKEVQIELNEKRYHTMQWEKWTLKLRRERFQQALWLAQLACST